MSSKRYWKELQARARVTPTLGRAVVRVFGSLAGGLAAWLLWATVQPAFWSPSHKERLVAVLWHAFGCLTLLPISSFVLFVLLRAARRPVTVPQTLGAISRALWLLPGIWLTQFALIYVLPLAAHAEMANLLANAGVVVGVTYLAATDRRPPLRRFRLGWAAIMTAVILAGDVTTRITARRTGQTQTDYSVAPPVSGLSGPAADLDRYFGALERDFQRASKQAEEVRCAPGRPRSLRPLLPELTAGRGGRGGRASLRAGRCACW